MSHFPIAKSSMYSLSRQRGTCCRRCRQPWEVADHSRCRRPPTLEDLEHRVKQTGIAVEYQDIRVRKAQGKLDEAVQAAEAAVDALEAFKKGKTP